MEDKRFKILGELSGIQLMPRQHLEDYLGEVTRGKGSDKVRIVLE